MSHRRRKTGLFFRLTASLSALVCAVLLLLGYALLSLAEDRYWNARQAEGIALARSIAEGSVDALVTNDYELLERWVASPLPSEFYAYSFMSRPDGQIIVHTNISNIGHAIAPLGKIDGATLRTLDHDGRPVVEVVYPALVAGRHLANTHLAYYRDVGELAWRDIARGIILILAAGLGVLTLGTYVISRRLTRPIGSLTALLEQTSLQDPTRVEEGILVRNDEVGTLAQAFDRMIDRLLHSHEALQEEKNRLDETVNALRESETRFREMAENIQQVFWIGEPGTRRVLYVSPAYEAIWGRSCASLYTAPNSALEAVVPEDRERVSSHLKEPPKDLIEQTYRISRPDGSLRWIRDRAFPVRDENGEIYRVAGIAEDITESVEREDQLRQALKMDAMGQLTGGVAHDFNNLLAVILGNAELLEEIVSSDDARERQLLDAVTRAASRGADLTQRLLAYSRRQPLHPQSLDLNSVVDLTIEMLGRTLGETIEIKTAHGADLWRCEVDPGQLENALINLAVNARDAMSKGGTLTIRTANKNLAATAAAQWEVVPGDYVVLSVRDTGCGMTPDVLGRVFEPFYTTKEVGKGSGLGLSMAYGFARQSGGVATIDSVRDRGTTVSLYLPRSRTADGVDKQQKDAATPPGHDEVVLVVEDDLDVRQLAVRQLQALSYRTLEAANAQAGIAVMAQDPHGDLLMTDMVLPGGMDDGALAREGRRRFPAIKVLFVSGYAKGVGDREDGPDSAGTFLQKPFRKTDLARKVRDMLDRKTV